MKRYSVIAALLISTLTTAQDALNEKASIFPSSIEINNPSKTQIENLSKLCKIWGFIKYKHPDVVSGSLDWDKELLKFLSLHQAADFEKQLYELLPQIASNLVEDSLGLVANPRFREALLLSENLQQYIQKLASLNTPEKQHYLEPGKWNITPHFKEEVYATAHWDDDGLKLLSLFRYWNIIEYFFPYKSLISKDWNNILQIYIPKVLDTHTELAYKLCLLELVAEINDGHGGIHRDDVLEDYFGRKQLPIQVKLMGDKIYVTDVFDEFEKEVNLKPGDILLSINNTPIQSMLLSKRKYISASTQAASDRQLAEWMIRTNASEAQVSIEKNGSIQQTKVPTTEYNTARYVQQDIAYYQEMADDISYIYPGSLANEKVDSVLNLIKGKKALILDYRCYPMANLQAKLPNVLLPYPKYAFQSDHYSVNPLGKFYKSQAYQWGSINNDYFKGQLIILVNEYTQSQPEFEILVYRQAPNTIVIGSSTAGALGNWTPIKLPLNILSSISGNGIYGINEEPVQRVGIIPDIYVEPSLESIKAGKDVVLLKALEYCKKL